MEKEATRQCGKCGTPLCEDCYFLFKKHLCQDCAKEQSVKDLVKPLVFVVFTLLIVGFLVYAFHHKDQFLFYDKYSKENLFMFENWFIFKDFSDFAKDFFLHLQTFLSNNGIVLKNITEEKMVMFLQIYWITGLPFCYYLLTRIMGIGLIIFLIKLVIMLIISPIITPIAFVFYLVNMIRNIINLIKIKQFN